MAIPGSLVAALLFTIIAVVLFVVMRSFDRKIKQATQTTEGANEYTHRGFTQHQVLNMRSIRSTIRIVLWAFGVFAVLAWVVSCFTTIGTKQVGVVTTFNRPVATMDNGLHFKAPWQKVTEMDAAIQTDNYVGDGAVQVRLANQSTAKVDTSVRWRIKQEAAGELYRDYRGFDKIRDSLVERNMKEALNEVFKNYDPLSTVKSAGANKQLTLQQLGTQVTEELRQRVGDQVEIQNVIIPLIRFDEGTQQRIDAYQAEIANTRIAAQRQETAAATARANRILAASVSKDPNVIVARCVEVLEQLAKDGKPLPAGFSCWPNGNAPAAVPVQ